MFVDWYKTNKNKVDLIVFAVISLFALAAVIFFCGDHNANVFSSNIPDGYVLQDRVSGTRFILPEEVVESEVSLDSMTAPSPEDLEKVVETNYVSRKEEYGAMVFGPNMMCLVVSDKNLFDMDLSSVRYTDEVEYILKKEAQIEDTLSVQNRINMKEEDGNVKIIVPVQFDQFSFSSLTVNKKYKGYAAVIENKDGSQGICIAIADMQKDSDQVKKWTNICNQIVLSFRVSSGDYSSYSNKIPEFSYESGGLINYPGYVYHNLGTDKMDTKGTYNQIDALLGMYCVETDYGPINLPYILNDSDMSSSIHTDGTYLQATIHSHSGSVNYSTTIKSREEGQTFNSAVNEVRSMIQDDYDLFSNQYGYTKQRIVSEDIQEDSGSAILTVCGWNENTADSTVIYYDLQVSQSVYTITKIEASKKVTEQFDPIMRRITELHHIVLV